MKTSFSLFMNAAMRCGIEWEIESCFMQYLPFAVEMNSHGLFAGRWWCGEYMALKWNVISGCMYDVDVMWSDAEGKYEKSIFIWKFIYVRQIQALLRLLYTARCSIFTSIHSQFGLIISRTRSFLDEVTVTKNENSCSILFIFFPGIYVTAVFVYIL